MDNGNPEIYDNDQRLKWNKKKFANSDQVSELNKEKVRKFTDKCYAEGLSDARVKKYITNFHTIFKLIDFNFCLQDANREDIERVVSRIERSEYSEATKT
ncbi:MAG: hypothetical protein ABEJ07_01625 [Candidatus Nanohaloarchaea archaeon]